MSKEAVPAGDKASFASIVKGTMQALRDQGGAIRLPAIPVKLAENGQAIPYKGVNALALSLAAERMGFKSSVWGSGKHLRAVTGHLIAKGQKATHAVYAGLSEVQVKPKKNEEKKAQAPVKPVELDPFADPADDANATPVDDTADDAPESAKSMMRRVYRVFPLFNAAQLNTSGISDAFERDIVHPKAVLPTVRHMQDRMEGYLQERAKTEIGMQHPINDAERAWIMDVALYLAYTTVGTQGVLRLPGDILADTTTFLKVIGTAQQCCDAIGLHHFNVYQPPKLVAVPATPSDVEVALPLPVEAKPQTVRTKRSQPASEAFDILSWFVGYHP